ncbi:hypothetical protein [Micromonospora sp. S4605]|uniref:hypothetical protein n=1 Tax=Micromonospora sp. S4605 TaxID=1420897 RepID=UPI0011B5F47D|nr:hypothetical protein [Micromonospora sp. S4605]
MTTDNLSGLAEALTDPVDGVVDPARCRRLTNPRAQHEVGTALDETVNATDDALTVDRTPPHGVPLR